MKRLFLAGFALLLAALSCGKVEGDGPRAVVSFGATLVKEQEDPSFRVTIDDGGTPSWVAGDKIMLYYAGGSCEATAQGSGSTTTFVTDSAIPTDKAVYCAVYPSSRAASFDGENVTVDFSQATEPALPSYSAVCTAKTTTCGGDLAFHNVGAMIKFTTTSSKIHEARFYGGNGNTYSVVGKSQDAVIPYAAGTYYIPVPAGLASEGFSLRLKNYDGEDYPAFYRPGSRTFVRSRIYDVGNIENKVFTDTPPDMSSFRLMSFNILRGDQKGPDNNWAARKESCLAMMEADAPDILCLQECTSTQRNDILAAFPRYGAVGVSVTNLKITSYPTVSSNPILYDSDKFRLEQWGTFWLSETPDEQSNTWYYRKPRTATWAQFRVKGFDKHFIFVSLHLQDNFSTGDSNPEIDYSGSSAEAGADCRRRETEVVTGKLPVINPAGYPTVIAGDCNSDGTQSYYNTLRNTRGFSLARESAGSGAGDRDTGPTFNGLGGDTYVLDNIFYKGIAALRFAVDRSAYAGREYISDHYPVYCDFVLITGEASLDPWVVEVF